MKRHIVLKYTFSIFLFIYVVLANSTVNFAQDKFYCLTGAFIADIPAKKDIANFKKDYGKKPYVVMVFIDWGRVVSGNVIDDVYTEDCVLMVTWEPWDAVNKKEIDYDGLLNGKYDNYIKRFAKQLKEIKKTVLLRFAHEMNGNWYPWAGTKIGKDKYIKVYKYVKDIFDKEKAYNVKWIFSINWEDIPKENNHFTIYYPGSEYVDYIGIDGYNWGATQSWSRWLSFKDLFYSVYEEISSKYKKPVIISEFSCASKGGDKVKWIKEAMGNIKNMPNIKAFVLFNKDKEVDWRFPPDKLPGKELKIQLEDPYFKYKGNTRI